MATENNNESVQVAVRVRPLVPSEIAKGCKISLQVFHTEKQVKIKDTDKAFTFNYVFDPQTSQDNVYDCSVKHRINNLFDGYNVTVLAYGQTGSGKTHTMGTGYSGEEDMGVIPRAVNDIFQRINDQFSFDFTVTVSFMELYQEILYDLLADKARELCILDIREDLNKNIIIPGLTEVPVESARDVLTTLMRGSRGRATAATNMNSQSSRSHAVFTINITMVNKVDNNENKMAKFHFVDLAGSERPKKTGAVGNTFKEGVNINKGLLVLGNVISALGDDNKPQFVPYRDSNLTRLLKDSLGGNSITLMIACVSPADYNIEETLSTLRYADRAKRIQNKPIINQDSKAVEINRLKKTIQELKLQIVGQGGPVVCLGELELLKKENIDLRIKIRDLTLQLSSTLNDNTGLLERIMILQNSNENLHKKIHDLKNEYDETVVNISTGLDQNNHEFIKENLKKLQNIQHQFMAIDTEQKNTENEIRNHEQVIDLHHNNRGSIDESEIMSKDQENYTNKQMALNNELQEINKKLAMKEHLARQIATNTQNLIDYNALAENEEKIIVLQKEKDELLQQLKYAQAQGNSGKSAEQRRKRVQELEGQIQSLNKKVQEQARLIKLKEKDVTKINQLNKDILEMKQMRVKLIKKMREESERFRIWKMQRERELTKLKQEDRKKQNKIVKMEVMHSKQQNVLKRKVEEAVALNKRLKDALALRKATQDSKISGKNDKIGNWLKQECQVYFHLIEAEATLDGLLDDRTIMQGQLDKLKESDDPDQSQIRNIEEDIDLRSAQIQSLQQKLLDLNEEKTIKFDNIQTMVEAKCAMKFLLQQCGDIKKNEVAMKGKLIESQACQNEFKEKIEYLERQVKNCETKHAENIANLQKDYEEKIAVLLRQLRGVQVEDANEELMKCCNMQAEKLDCMNQTNQELMEQLQESQTQVEDLKVKLDTIKMAKDLKNEEDFKALPKRVKKMKKQVGSTSFSKSEENLDVSVEDNDDVFNDPDWRNTPLGKWLLERKRNPQMNTSFMEETPKIPVKRNSEGGCTCLKSNCTKRCGCKKLKQPCTVACKCSSEICSNRTNSNIEVQAESTSFTLKKTKLKKKNLFPLQEINS